MRRLIGIIIIAAGILLFLTNFNVLGINDIGRILWPVALMTIGAYGFIDRRRLTFFYTALFTIGLVGLLITLNILESDAYGLILGPILLVFIGVSIFNHTHHHAHIYSRHRDRGSVSNEGSYTAVFSEVVKKNNDKEFVGCDLTTVFGSNEVDFSEIKLKEDKAHINVLAVFGGTLIILPKGYKVVINGTPIFGGCENNLNDNNPKAKQTIIIEYTCIFGGVEIKN